jgi:hypothetical protein
LISKILLPLLLSTSALAFNKDFTIVADRAPLEFVHLFESMKIHLKAPADQLKFVGICKALNENLGSLRREHIFLLMKSEVIKNVLEHKHSKVRSFDVTNLLIRRLEEDLQRKQGLLTPFSQWIYRSIIAELKHREALGLLGARSFNAGSFDGAKRAEALRFSRYLTYLLPWIDKMDALSAADFNGFTARVSWVVLERLNQRSLLFKRFAATAAGDSPLTIFNIPAKLVDLHPEDIKRIRTDAAPLTLSEEAAKEKTEASKGVQNVAPDDLSPLSDEVSKELEKKAP